MGSGEIKSSVRNKGIVLVTALSVLQSIFRLIFAYMGMTGAELLEVEIASSTQQMINILFLFIGVIGLITAFGLYQMLGILGYNSSQCPNHRVRYLGSYNTVNSSNRVDITSNLYNISITFPFSVRGGNEVK